MIFATTQARLKLAHINIVTDSMVTCSTPANLEQLLHNSEHLRTDVAADALLLSILKPLETHLQKRRLLRQATVGSSSPIWFSAVTERNVFLWRKGYSLREQDRFEFWVVPEKLIEKRIEQLRLIRSGDLQFITGTGGLPTLDVEGALREEEYLRCFLEIYNRIDGQAFVLSQVQLRIEQELAPKRGTRIPICLPYRCGKKT